MVLKYLPLVPIPILPPIVSSSHVSILKNFIAHQWSQLAELTPVLADFTTAYQSNLTKDQSIPRGQSPPQAHWPAWGEGCPGQLPAGVAALQVHPAPRDGGRHLHP